MTSRGDDFAPRIRVRPPGPRARRILARDRRVISPAVGRPYPLVVEWGNGSHVFDVDGNRFLDFTSGVAVNAVGQVHPEVLDAIIDQAAHFIHVPGPDFSYEVLVAFAEKICGLAPGREPKQCFLTNSGTETIEAAIKLARWNTGRSRLVAFYDGFHGRSLGALSLTASKPVQRRGFGALLPGVSHAPFGDLAFIEQTLFRKTTPPEDVAAIIVEPIQGEGGYNVAPRGFLKGLRRLCDRHGILLIADEIQSGLGRTGKMWAIDHSGVVPDILCVAKPVGGGLPLGAMIARKKLHTWPEGAHSNTFGGNALACAAGLRTLELIEDGLVDNARRMGARLRSGLQRLSRRHRLAGPPRGLGLMLAIDILDRKGRPDPRRRDRVVTRAFRSGLLLLGCGEAAIRFLPALNVERGHVDAALDCLGKALAAS